MKKERIKGFVLGVSAAVLVMCLSVTALAATRNISVSDGIKVVLNGQTFQPKDGNGAPVELFAYNGTIYAPVRAICEAAGLNVSYDANTKTAYVTSSGAASTTPAASTGDYIGEERAKELALQHAGVSAAKATFIKAKLDREDGRMVYDVEFYSGQTEYDYEIDALTGAVISYDHDFEGSVPTQQSAGYISAEKAKSIALERAPGASVVECKLDYDDGVAVYELELRNGRTEYECELNASTGAVIKWEVDYD